jgi:sugar lactone lactonase YvrE
LTAVHPGRATEGGRIELEGVDFPIDGPELPAVRIGEARARILSASSTCIAARVPSGLDGGSMAVRIDGVPEGAAVVEVGVPFATGLHQVDKPVFDREGNLYVTYSGTRGQQVPVSIFRVHPNGTRETFSSGIVNPTSMALDPEGRLHVSSRFEGTVYRVSPDGSVEPFANDLGVACGLAFGADGSLFVGDRSGTIFRVDRERRASMFAALASSVAAFHLAIGPDRALYVTAPTLSSYDSIFRIDPEGVVTTWYSGFGRPQGLGFDSTGTLFVVEALSGVSGLYRLPADGAPELVVTGQGLIGFAFDPRGGLVVCSNDTAYRINK